MKNQLNGFKEGTQGITTGDKMKPWDHRRDKRNCHHFKNGYCEILSQRCTGSSHCDYYDDGIKPSVIVTRVNPELQKRLLDNFLKDLHKRIDHRSLEGKYICDIILRKFKLNRLDPEKAKCEIEEFDRRKKALLAEIEEHNSKLKNRCVLIGLLIVTAPFCYSYYRNHLRNADDEINALQSRAIDSDLQSRVKQYDKEMERYKKASEEGSKPKYIKNKDEEFLCKAIQAYNSQDYGHFYGWILKSIRDYSNTCAVLYLADFFKNGTIFEKNDYNYLLLVLYASYLGDRDASRILADRLLEANCESARGLAFLKKANRQ